LGPLKFYIKFTALAVALALLHYLILANSQLHLERSEFYTIHIFNYSLSALTYLFIVFSSKKWKDQGGFVFLGVSVFKMLFTLVYLGGVIINRQNVENFALQFVFIYFIYLFYDVFVTVKALNTSA
jgi:hypothetical protein